MCFGTVVNSKQGCLDQCSFINFFFGFRGYWLLIFLPKERRVPEKNVVFGIWFKESWQQARMKLSQKQLMCICPPPLNYCNRCGNNVDCCNYFLKPLSINRFTHWLYPTFFPSSFPKCRLASIHTLQESFKMYKMDITDACFRNFLDHLIFHNNKSEMTQTWVKFCIWAPPCGKQ